MAGIFLSYSRADRPIAQGIAEALEAEGFTVWWDKVLRAGQTYDEVTESMLRESSVVVVLWSQTSVKSKWVRAEATLGERNAVVIPAMIEDADRPIMFELTQSADLIGWAGDRSETRWKDFISDIRRIIEPVEAAPVAPVVAAPTADATIENTYWTSIQDTRDPSELESYLKRYPEGHFSDLARSRLKTLTTVKAAPSAPETVVPAPAPRPRPAPAPTPTTPKPPAPAPREGSKVPLIVGGVLALAAIVLGVVTFLPGGGPDPDAENLAADVIEPVATPIVETVTDPVVEPVVEPVVVPEPEIIVEMQPAATCEGCPPLVEIPSGTFKLGSPNTEARRVGNEGPQKDVTIAAFEISRTEITHAEWDACADDYGCRSIRVTGDDLPVSSVSWDDAQAYLRWLSVKSGRAFRLPSEAEWEYAARAGTTTAYWWGDQFDRDRIVSGTPAPAASQPENAFGLVGMSGNVREWVEDCYVNSYTNAASDGRAVQSGNCNLRVIRGGSYKHGASEHRSANRARVAKSTKDPAVGFRVVVSSPAGG